MADWKKISIQAVSYVIASGLIISGFNIFYNDFYNKPHIKLEIKEHIRSAEVVVTNDGNTPARNFVLTLETPQDMIKESPQIFTTANQTKITEISPKLFKVYVSMFAKGEGSIIEIDMAFSPKQNMSSSNYVAYATYDQGSIKTTLPQKPLTIGEAFFNFWNTYGISIILIVIGLAVFAVIWLVLLGPFHLLVYKILRMINPFPSIFSRLPRYKSASEILDSVVDIRYILSSRLPQSSFNDFINKWYGNNGKIRRQLFNNNMKDYILIEEFYNKLGDRKSLLTKKAVYDGSSLVETEHNPEDLNRINNEILYLCRYLILELDWTKYE